MRDQGCPECRWVAVVDGSGRRRVEMRWVMPRPPVAEPASGTAAAAKAA
jgi:hypothetical protein